MAQPNITSLPGDIFQEIDNGPASDSTYPVPVLVLMFGGDILVFLITLISLGASVFLIYITLRFERLKSKSNIFVLHYAIACVINNAVFPLTAMVAELSLVRRYSSTVHCISEKIAYSDSILVLIAATYIAGLWYLKSFHGRFVARYPRFQLWLIISAYLIYAVKICLCITSCFFWPAHFQNSLISVFYIMGVVTVVFINLAVHKATFTDDQESTRYQLFISSYVIFSYFPLFLYTVLCLFTGWFPVFVSIPEMIAYSSPIMVVYFLGVKNKFYKSVYEKVFKKSTRTYTEEDLVETSDVEEDRHSSTI